MKRRFYTTQPLIEGIVLWMDQQKSRHLLQVLRMSLGDKLSVFDGQGNEHEAELFGTADRCAGLLVGKALPVTPPSPCKVHLVQALCAPQKLALVLQKSVELGVDALTLVQTERSTVQLKAVQQKMERWETIVTQACEQSGRAHRPALNPPGTWSDHIVREDERAVQHLLLHPAAEKPLSSLEPLGSDLVIYIGPEGGFSDAEIAALEADKMVHRIRLGQRVLRTETAGLACLAALQCLKGDF